MAESVATPFVIHGARDAVAGGLTHVNQQVKSIEQAVAENPGLAFDLAKTLVESVCRAVLGERNIAFSEDDDLPKLFKTASLHLPPVDRALERDPTGVPRATRVEAGTGADVSQFTESDVEQAALAWLETPPGRSRTGPRSLPASPAPGEMTRGRSPTATASSLHLAAVNSSI